MSAQKADMAPANAFQYLSDLLSQRGPRALPYSADVKFLIRQHLMDLTQEIATLRVRQAPFVYNNGKSAELLQVEGTIPIAYRGMSYNTPVVIWLLELYPRFPPLVFVSPTKDMVIKRSHRHVDASGTVFLPYLQNWTCPNSNLVDLARALSFVFSKDPPLLSRSLPAQQPPRSLPASQGPAALINHTSTPSSSSAMPQAQSSVTAARHHPDIPGSTPSSGASPSWQTNLKNGRFHRTNKSSEVLRKKAVKTLGERLNRDILQLRKNCEKDLDERHLVQSQLKQRESELDVAVSDLQQENESLRQNLAALQTNTGLLESWLREKGNLSVDNIDVADAFRTSDARSEQILKLLSFDCALEDVLYSLDKAVDEGLVPADVYLKHVRNVAREQFFHRAAVSKIDGALEHIQISNDEVGHDL